GLAAAAFADHADPLAGADGEGDVASDRGLVIALLERNAQIAYSEQGFRCHALRRLAIGGNPGVGTMDLQIMHYDASAELSTWPETSRSCRSRAGYFSVP